MRRRSYALRRRYGHAGKRGLQSPPPVGARVRLTGAFLKSTGQHRGREGVSVWTVTGNDGDFVITNEPMDSTYVKEMWGDLPEAERPKFRRINRFNLEIVGARPKAGDYP
jgi:hypothetical protein